MLRDIWYNLLQTCVVVAINPRPHPPFLDESDSADLENCFDTEDEAGSTGSDTNLTDYDSDAEGGDVASGISTIDENEDKDRPLEYYLNQKDKFDEPKYIDEVYRETTTLLLGSGNDYVLCSICCVL